jgi:hypothetical protein
MATTLFLFFPGPPCARLYFRSPASEQRTVPNDEYPGKIALEYIEIKAESMPIGDVNMNELLLANLLNIFTDIRKFPYLSLISLIRLFSHRIQLKYSHPGNRHDSLERCSLAVFTMTARRGNPGPGFRYFVALGCVDSIIYSYCEGDSLTAGLP